MRKNDKTLNIIKANILNENRYVQNKLGFDSEGELNKGDEIVWVSEPKQIGEYVVNTNDSGTYIGRETSGEHVVSFGPYRFYASNGSFTKKNEDFTDESLKRSSNSSTNKTSDTNKKVVGSDNVNAIKKIANDPYKLKKALDSQNNYRE